MFDISFIDFDSTLYDTADLSYSIQKIIFGLGVSEEDYKKTAVQATYGKDNNHNNYTFEFHLQLIEDLGYVFSVDETIHKLVLLLEKDRKYSDAISFLKFIKKISKRLILLSVGNPDFQNKKIDVSGIRGYFDEVIIPQKEKEAVIRDHIQDDEKGLFVNDKLGENKKILEDFDNIVVITKEHPHKYSTEEMKALSCPHFKTLTEIQNYVAKKFTS